MVDGSEEGDGVADVQATGQPDQRRHFRAIAQNLEHARSEVPPIGRDRLDQQVDPFGRDEPAGTGESWDPSRVHQALQVSLGDSVPPPGR